MKNTDTIKYSSTASVFLCIFVNFVSQQNYLFKKKVQKSIRAQRRSEKNQKRTFAQNCFNLTIQNEITTKLFLYKKREKIYLPYKSSDIKKLRQLYKNG